jgi:hypothetical protein
VRSGLRTTITQYPAATERLFWQSPKGTLIQIFKILFPGKNMEQQLNYLLNNKLTAPGNRSIRSKEEFRTLIYKTLISFWINNTDLKDGQALLEQVAVQWNSESDRFELSEKVWRAWLRQIPRDSSYFEAIKKLKSQPELWETALPKLILQIKKEDIKVLPEFLKWVENISSKTDELSAAPEIPKERPEKEGLFIENAGLVLIHPFLLHFLKALDLCNDQSFKDEKAQVQAIHLLHYLATGTTQPVEYELVFNKVLCNWPLDRPLKRRVRISKKMKKEAENMLLACLKHWTVLKGSSTDALRGNFLLREGKLVRKDKGWQLIVERKAQDILLDSLPWGFGTIKLPWMEEILFVEW